MPQPTLSQVHVSAPLTNLSVAYMTRKEKFKADLLSPIVPVSKSNNKYFVFDKGDFHRDEMQIRSPGSNYARSGYNLSTAEYTCVNYGLEHVVADEIAANFDSPLSADKAAVAFLMQKVLIKRERKFVSTFLAASTWGNDVAGHASNNDDDEHVFWDNASADIIGTLWKWSDTVMENTGYRPNRFVTTPQVWRVMANDPDIVDRHKYTSSEPISAKAIAQLCGLGSPESPGEIIVLEAPYNSAKEGQTATMDFMAGDVGLLMYVAPSPQIDAPSACYTFSWSEFDTPNLRSSGAAAISTYRQEEIKSDVYRAEAFFDMKVVASDCGVYFSNLLT